MTQNIFGDAVLNGSLLLAIPVALLAGLVSFLSPCVLPLVPGYLGYVTGLTGASLESHKRGRVLLGIALFVLGFTVVFVFFGAALGSLGPLITTNADWITRILGLVVIVMGVVFLGGFSWLQSEARIHAKPPAGLWGAPLLGVTFGLGWVPCIGPTMAAVQALSFSGGTSAVKGGVLSFIYCVGLGLPFLLIALGLRQGMNALKWFRKHRRGVQRFGGGMLVAVGVLMVSGLWSLWIAQFQGMLSSVILPV